MLVEYYYDWYAGDGQILQKFHAHYHPKETPEDVVVVNNLNQTLHRQWTDQTDTPMEQLEPEGVHQFSQLKRN
jgi:hypothetical protein